LPAKRAWCRSPGSSSSANMAANPLETRIPPTAAKRFGQHRPALNPQKDIFYVRLRPLAWGDHMLSQKLLLNDGVFTFAGENRPSAAKIH
jgi:hypothetical protein